MKNIISLLLVGLLAWYGYGKYEQRKKVLEETPITSETSAPVFSKDKNDSRFSCDGRTYCSQMTSCAEATYFIKNCPGTKMDGNHDGIPCETQWCK